MIREVQQKISIFTFSKVPLIIVYSKTLAVSIFSKELFFLLFLEAPPLQRTGQSIWSPKRLYKPTPRISHSLHSVFSCTLPRFYYQHIFFSLVLVSLLSVLSSIIHHPSSVIHRPSSIIHHQSFDWVPTHRARLDQPFIPNIKLWPHHTYITHTSSEGQALL